jgi:DNA-directed RNA polymerase specialized sigma24 family protein
MAQIAMKIRRELGLEAPSDAVVIERSLRRLEHFAAVFDRHYAAIHGYVARRLGAALADDVASETFLVAFDRRHRYDLGQPDASPWLYGIASNLVARHRRAEVRRYRMMARAGVEDVVDGHGESSDGRLDAQALRSRLAAALAALNRPDREVCCSWPGLSSRPARRPPRCGS